LPHLTAAQVYVALSYYYEYRREIDQLIQESQPGRIIATHGLKIEKAADGVAIARAAS